MKDVVYTNGVMVESMKELGNVTNYMEKESIVGQTEDFMKENGKMMKNMAMELMSGLVARDMKGTGETAFAMDKVSSLMPVEDRE